MEIKTNWLPTDYLDYYHINGTLYDDVAFNRIINNINTLINKINEIYETDYPLCTLEPFTVDDFITTSKMQAIEDSISVLKSFATYDYLPELWVEGKLIDWNLLNSWEQVVALNECFESSRNVTVTYCSTDTRTGDDVYCTEFV